MPPFEGAIGLSAQVMRFVVDNAALLDGKPNQEKADLVSEKIADKADAAIELPAMWEPFDSIILVQLLAPLLKSYFDQVWPEAA